MSTDPFNVGVSALEAYAMQIDVSANNVANAGPAPATAGYGPLVPGFIESSNVDIADEIIKMTASQAAYKANAVSIRTADQMLKIAVNIDAEGRTA